MSFMFGLYYIGQVMFHLFLVVEPEPKVALELFGFTSLVMFAHTFGLKETVDLGLTYDLKEVEEEDDE